MAHPYHCLLTQKLHSTSLTYCTRILLLDLTYGCTMMKIEWPAYWAATKTFLHVWCNIKSSVHAMLSLCCSFTTRQRCRKGARMCSILHPTRLFSERELSSVCLSVVCNVRGPYSGGSNFPQYFYGIRYSGHPLTSTENFTGIIPGEPLCRGS